MRSQNPTWLDILLILRRRPDPDSDRRPGNRWQPFKTTTAEVPGMVPGLQRPHRCRTYFLPILQCTTGTHRYRLRGCAESRDRRPSERDTLPLEQVLFGNSPRPGFSVRIHLNTDRVGTTADRTVFDKSLALSLSQVERNDNWLTAGIADISHFRLHAKSPCR